VTILLSATYTGVTFYLLTYSLAPASVKNDGSSDEAKLEWYDGGPWDKVFLWLFEDGNEWVQIAERVHGTEDGFLLALDDGREEWFENSELPLEVCRELRHPDVRSLIVEVIEAAHGFKVVPNGPAKPVED